MIHAYICDAIRTPFGRFGGSLSSVRTDDLGAIPLKALMVRNPDVNWTAVDDVIFGCANQAGEDNRNVARMSSLLAGLPLTVSAITLNRLCGSSLDAVAMAARAIKAEEAELIIAGGVESMSRAPYVMGKSSTPFARNITLEDTTLGWRFINPLMQENFGIDSMSETAENIATEFGISRADQDAFAIRSQHRTKRAGQAGYLAEEITPVIIPQRKASPLTIDTDEHPRPDSSQEQMAKLKGLVHSGGSITAGNAAGINDGAAAIIIANERAIKKYALRPRARIICTTTIGLEPRIMGFGPSPAIKKLLSKTKLNIEQIDLIELNEAFAAQVLAVTRDLGLADDSKQVNPNGGAIALGHPLGTSGARLIIAAVNQLQRTQGRYAICSMCIGVGQGIATLIERVQ